MKNSAFFFVSLSLVSCSHFSEAPKTVHFPYAEELLQEIQKGNSRAPASQNLSVNDEKSPRRVYFSALYHQYLTLTQPQAEAPIESCPQFHHDKVETDEKTLPQVTFYKPSKVAPEGAAYFPELAFSKKFSLKDYVATVREELDVLCDEGVSDNFFKFDNLVTNYADKKSFHSRPEAMVAILKIPVFANFYLVHMLNSHPTPFTNAAEARIIELTQTYWFDHYVSRASEKRDVFIKNKMVQR